MTIDLHIAIHWLEEEVTPEKRRAYQALDQSARIAACREVLRKNSTALGMRKQDVDRLDDATTLEHTKKLYEKYRHYIDRMERKA